MENVRRFPAIIFGNFPACIKTIFDDENFQKIGVQVVKPPIGFYNTGENPRWEDEIQIEQVNLVRMKPVPKVAGLYEHLPKGNLAPMSLKSYLKVVWDETKQLMGIKDVDKFEEVFWRNPSARTQIYGFTFDDKKRLFKPSHQL